METDRRALPGGLASGLVFLASGAVLVLEVVALRLIGPYVGVTLQTSSSVIGLALAAIAYGAWTGGWLADRRDPRRLLPPVLVLAGVATGLTLPIVRYAGEVLRGDAVGAILLLTALTVFVPAALLSAVTPLVVKLQLGDLARTGQVVGKLSSVGTLGAVTATLVTGFVLVAALPSSLIMLGLGVVLGGVGLALAAYLRRRDTGSPVLPLPGKGRARAALAIAGLAGAGLTAVAPNPCDAETAYHCAAVTADPDRPDGRMLWLNSARHSYQDLVDPTHLEFAYVQWIGALVDVMAPADRPLPAVHLGGGGFTLPRYLEATRPGGVNVVLELDGELVELDRERLGLRTGPTLRVEVGDGRVRLAEQPDDSAALLVGDAFGHLVVPWHLATRELVTDVRRVLRPDGVYAQNVIDYPPFRFVRAEVATVAAVFPHVAVAAVPDALAGRRGANFVIAASDRPLPLEQWRDRLGEAATEPVTVLDGQALADFVGDARVLTDDHAPVDQLLASP
ncbi:MAG TPA: fused MFS/spermidine synthase [Micromonosporaceae bacterium]|nr:fused MFS/spermidine synthase [Micromonosporaceae bacterium]